MRTRLQSCRSSRAAHGLFTCILCRVSHDSVALITHTSSVRARSRCFVLVCANLCTLAAAAAAGMVTEPWHGRWHIHSCIRVSQSESSTAVPVLSTLWCRRLRRPCRSDRMGRNAKSIGIEWWNPLRWSCTRSHGTEVRLLLLWLLLQLRSACSVCDS